MDEILRLLTEILNIDFIRGIISNPRDKTGIIKIKVRPLEKKGKLLFQIESFTKTQAFHENLTVEDACRKIAILSSLAFGQQVDYEDIYTEGITGITVADIALINDLQKSIKANKVISFLAEVQREKGE